MRIAAINVDVMATVTVTTVGARRRCPRTQEQRRGSSAVPPPSLSPLRGGIAGVRSAPGAIGAGQASAGGGDGGDGIPRSDGGPQRVDRRAASTASAAEDDPPLPPPDAASAAADGAIFVWLTILIVLGANLPLGHRTLRRNSMREISGSFSPLAPEFFSPSRD
jgi:hypothetical protein